MFFLFLIDEYTDVESGPNVQKIVDIIIDALENPEIKQQSCWDFAFGDDEEEKVWRIACHKCRDICPYNLGSQNSILRKNN